MKLEESETLELKKSTSELKEAVISISSILNKHQAGELYFGVRNDGKILGQQVGKGTIRDISQKISNHIQPRIYPEIEIIEIEGKDCIKVSFKGDDAPYYAYGRVYMRTADEDNLLSPGDIERLILARNQDKHYWDNQKSGKTIDDVNEEVLKNFMEKARQEGRLDFEYNGVEGTLNKLGLLENGNLLRAAELLFCDENALEFQAAIFAGKDKTTFLDIKQLKGNFFHVLKEVELYIKNHMRWSVKFGKLEREEIPEIPVKALREAIVNSLCHRDYVNPKGNEVAIFKDRIEIYNPGTFPQGLEPEDFITGEERSVLRNPLLANTIYLSKDIERWGSGLKRIHDECEANDVNVGFRHLKTGFVVEFGRKEESDEKLAETGVKPRVKTRVKTRDKIIRLIEEHPEITVRELAENIGITVKGIEWQINKLKKEGTLKRVGPAKGGHWQIAEAGNE